ncbi:MAG: aminopeptidase P family protein [Vicinamibacteria bacterium]|nr:aminopeptidase P family protein [Vicinamibacteria bacterium]
MTVRLLYAASEHDADILYPSGFFAPDPFLCLIAGTRTILVMSDLELDRAKRESKATQVWPWSQLARRTSAGVGAARAEHVIFACLKRLGVKHAEVPGSFPLGLARRLEGLGIRLRVAKEPFWPEREIKTRHEVKKIEASLRAAEAGLLAGIETLKSTRIGRDGWLWLGRAKFTSEDLRDVIDSTILKLGGIPVRTICAGGDQAVDPHEIGHGPLRAHAPIVMDIFPRSQASGYFGDLTRTVVRGRASEKLKEVYALVEEATNLGHRSIRDGADGRLIHDDILALFASRGFKTGIKDGRMQGFFHGTGHGLGLEIHEAPSISRRGSLLRAGHVVTVEPGLYYLGIGGVRIEDVALVTKTGSRNLTLVPKVLQI